MVTSHKALLWSEHTRCVSRSCDGGEDGEDRGAAEMSPGCLAARLGGDIVLRMSHQGWGQWRRLALRRERSEPWWRRQRWGQVKTREMLFPRKEEGRPLFSRTRGEGGGRTGNHQGLIKVRKESVRGFLTPVLLTSGLGHPLQGHPGHRGVWSSLPGLHPLNARRPPVITTTDVPRHHPVSPTGQNPLGQKPLSW